MKRGKLVISGAVVASVAVVAAMWATGAAADDVVANDPTDAQTSESDVVRIEHSHEGLLLLHEVEVAGDLQEGFTNNLRFELRFDIDGDGTTDRTILVGRAQGRVVAEVTDGSQSFGFADLRFPDASTFQVLVSNYQLKAITSPRGVRSYEWHVVSDQAYAVPFPCSTEEPTPAPSPSPMCHGDVFSGDRAPDDGAITHDLEGFATYADVSKTEVDLFDTDRGFTGQIYGPKRCLGRREVRVYRVEEGRDFIVENDATMIDGIWRLSVPRLRPGKYVARLVRDVREGPDPDRYLICTGDTSNRTTVS